LLADLSSAGVNTQILAGTPAPCAPAPAWSGADLAFQHLLVAPRETVLLANSPIAFVLPSPDANVRQDSPATDLHAVVSQFWAERSSLRDMVRFSRTFEEFWLFLTGYLATALWSSTDDAGESLDQRYDINNFSSQTIQNACRICLIFMAQTRALLELCSHVPLSDLGTDFWLTRCRHGSGFWDREYAPPEILRGLTDAAHTFGETSVVVGDNGYLHIEP
jgi:hypothetical protein